MKKEFAFNFDNTSIESARIGILDTPHGTVHTPNFIFCGTKGSIKGLPSHQVQETGAEIILANTYHLMLNPGSEHIKLHGGLHKFMNWKGPMLTDSGGYQVFAMGHGSVSAEIKKGQCRTLPRSLLSISEEQVVFKSYLDGSIVTLSPEKATNIQKILGADIIMQFDECTPFHVDKKYTANSMHRSIRWGNRCIKEFQKHDNNTQVMYGIAQGGIYEDLRKESATRISEQKFWGNAIGGSLGSNKNQMHDIVALTSTLLKSTRPIHLLGIGDIPDIFWGIRQGIDTFDCVHPTRIARHGCAIVPGHIEPNLKLNIKNKRFSIEDIALDPNCTQICCTQHSRAYIHYLFKAKELLGMYLLTLHNIAQMVRLMQDIRKGLLSSLQSHSNKTFLEVEKFWLGK